MAFYPIDVKESSVTHGQNRLELWFRSNRRIKKVNPDEILYCEYKEGFIDVMLINGNKIRAYNFLSRLEDRLKDANFFRIHRNKLVNLRQIKEIDKLARMIRLKGNHNLNIAPGRLEELQLIKEII